MGPVVNRELTQWRLRPFQSSTTFQLLRQHPVCNFHVTDDVLLVVQALLGSTLDAQYTRTEGGWILQSACHWYRLRIQDWQLDEQRSEARATLDDQGVLRPFWGWNRAKHAILEACILISRVHLLSLDEIERQFELLRPAVTKTAGDRELAAWDLLEQRLEMSKFET